MNFLVRFLISGAYIGVLGILANLIGERVPRRWFRPDRFPYRPWKWEKGGKIYEIFGVHKWKDRAPDMSRVNKKMVPKRVGIAPTSTSVHRLIIETCVAEATHTLLCIFGIGIFFFWMNPWGILFSALDILGNLPFIMIQRYNRPTLVGLANRLEAREERKRKYADTDFIGEHGGRA